MSDEPDQHTHIRSKNNKHESVSLNRESNKSAATAEQPRLKTLQIEGVNAPGRTRNASVESTPSRAIEKPRSKALQIEGVNTREMTRTISAESSPSRAIEKQRSKTLQIEGVNARERTRTASIERTPSRVMEKSRSKTLQIEGVTTTESAHHTVTDQSIPSRESGTVLPNRGQHAKTFQVGVDSRPSDLHSEQQSLSPTLTDSGILLDVGDGASNKSETETGSTSWLRKRQTLQERDSNMHRRSDYSDEDGASSAKRIRTESAEQVNKVKASKPEDNFDFLLEGIEHELFDDF